MAEYKIGQILTISENVEMKKALSDKPEIVKKGTEIIIGADGLAHHIFSGNIQPISKDSVIKGYDSEGIAAYITKILSRKFPLDEMLEDYDINKSDFRDEIEYLLDEIGM